MTNQKQTALKTFPKKSRFWTWWENLAMNDSLPGLFYEWFYRIKSWLRRNIRYRFFDKYHILDTKLPPNYYDLDQRLVHAIMESLVEFVEKERPFEMDWDWEPYHKFAKVDILRAYKWWKQFKTYPEDIWLEMEKKEKEDDNVSLEDIDILDKEEWWEEQVTHHLVNIVKLRGLLWT